MGATSSKPPKVAVLMGGISAEREVSLRSGRECATALREAGYEVVELDAGPDLPARLAENVPDVAFNALHGRWGEDGCVQGLLEWMRIPYTHSGVLASALAMDKVRAKRIFAAAGLPVAQSLVASRAEIEARHLMAPPYVVKPVNEGSSVGVHIVLDADAPPPDLPRDLPEMLMVEAYVPGRELSVSVMGDRALAVTDIRTDGWYDYHAKYAEGGSRHVIPAQLPSAIYKACREIALAAHEALGCRGLSRADLRWDEARGAQGLVLLEVNTQPGMTPTSLSPEQAAHEGMNFAELCRWMVEDASCDR